MQYVQLEKNGNMPKIILRQTEQLLYTYRYDSLNTGQDVSYATGDDKWVRDNVFIPEINSWDTSLKWVFPVLNQTDPLKLLRGSNPDGSGNNIFGNLERFTALDGTQTYTDNLQIDHYLGLMTTKDAPIAGSFNVDLFPNAISFTRSGYNDFFVPNNNQHALLQFSDTINKNIYPWSNIAIGTTVLSSTTDTEQPSLSSIAIVTNRNQLLRFSKTISSNAFLCRKAFTYNPTTKQMELS